MQLLLWSVLGVALALSLVTDLLWRRIFDAVTYPALLLCLALRFWREGLGGWELGLVSGLVAAAGAGGLFALLALRGQFGWGDVKLVAVVGAALGYPLVLAALVFISLVGAAQAIVALLWRRALWETVVQAAARWAARLGVKGRPVESTRRHIPYGVAIAVGSAWAMWWQHAST